MGPQMKKDIEQQETRTSANHNVDAGIEVAALGTLWGAAVNGRRADANGAAKLDAFLKRLAKKENTQRHGKKNVFIDMGRTK